jgi:hypothetical protein
MRQPPGNDDFIEIIEIDVIDADPAAFGEPSVTGAPRRERRPRPRWLVPAALTAASVAAVGVLVWQPWDVPPQWRTFDVPAAGTATISNLLLPASAPGVVVEVTEPDTVGSNTPTSAPGYVFAEKGATFGFRRAAIFEAEPTGAADAAPATTTAPDTTDSSTGFAARPTPTVHGIPAQFDSFRLRNQVEWGPRAGYNWRLFTTGFSDDETLAFAAAVGTQAGAPALRHDYRIDDLLPLGSSSAFNSASSLRNELTGGHLSSPVSPTVVTYVLDDETELRVASVPAPPDAMQLVGYVFGAGTATTVHGMPAQLIDSREAGPMVIWLEGGRLITVAGPATDERLQAIADSVRPVGGDEWLNTVNAVLEYYIPVDGYAPAVEVGTGVTDTGVGWKVDVTIGNPTVTCVYLGNPSVGTESDTPDVAGTSACTFSTPRTPATREFTGAFPGLTFVVAIIPADDYRLVLRVTGPDGTITDHEPVRLNDEFIGVAVAVAAGSTHRLVDPSA